LLRVPTLHRFCRRPSSSLDWRRAREGRKGGRRKRSGRRYAPAWRAVSVSNCDDERFQLDLCARSRTWSRRPRLPTVLRSFPGGGLMPVPHPRSWPGDWSCQPSAARGPEPVLQRRCLVVAGGRSRRGLITSVVSHLLTSISRKLGSSRDALAVPCEKPSWLPPSRSHGGWARQSVA
jgi:hypothetical protein